MSKAKLRNQCRADKVKLLNAEIDSAVIKRIIEAFDGNKILAVFNEIIDHPAILYTEIDYGGGVQRISEHIKCKTHQLSEAKLLKIQCVIDTLPKEDADLQIILGELLPEKYIDPKDILEVLPSAEDDDTRAISLDDTMILPVFQCAANTGTLKRTSSTHEITLPDKSLQGNIQDADLYGNPPIK
jgi:hypothetical protein